MSNVYLTIKPVFTLFATIVNTTWSRIYESALVVYASYPLLINLLEEYGGVSATLVRNSSQYGIDNENVMHQIPAGMPVFDGMRPVTQLFVDPAILATQGITTRAGEYRVSFNGSGTITFSGTATDSLVGVDADTRKSILLTTTAGTLTCTVTGSVTFALAEDVTGKTNQNPSEYGLGTTWYGYANPFTVLAGVVTEGAHVPLTTGRNGVLLEPLSTNKCLCDYYIPADRTSYGPTYVEAQTLRKGSVCEIVTRTTLDFDTIGTLLSGTANTVGAQYLITGVALLGAGDSAKQDLAVIGTKSYYVDGAFVQNMRDSADNVVMTLSGDIAGVLSIVADQAAVDAAGYGRVTNGGKVLNLDNGLGVAVSSVRVGGAVSVTGQNSFSLVYKSTGGNGLSVTMNGGEGRITILLSEVYIEAKSEDFYAVATRYMSIDGQPGSNSHFLAPQLEELPFATGPIPCTAGATGTRLATILSAPTPIYTSGVWHEAVTWTPRSVIVGRVETLLDQMADVNNGLRLISDGSAIYFEKMVAGVSERASLTMLPVKDTTYVIDPRMLADNTLSLFVDGMPEDTNTSTPAAVTLGTTTHIGSDGVNSCMANIQNVLIDNKGA